MGHAPRHLGQRGQLGGGLLQDMGHPSPLLFNGPC